MSGQLVSRSQFTLLCVLAIELEFVNTPCTDITAIYCTNIASTREFIAKNGLLCVKALAEQTVAFTYMLVYKYYTYFILQSRRLAFFSLYADL